MVTVQTVGPTNFAAAAEYLHAADFSISGMSRFALVTAICRDAGKGEVFAQIGRTSDQRIVAATIAVRDSPRYFRRFLIHHPELWFPTARRRLRRRRPVRSESRPGNASWQIPKEWLGKGEPPVRWYTSGRQVAGVLYTAVSPDARGQALTGRLRQSLFESLAAAGARYVVARIAYSNTPAIKMCGRSGYLFWPDTATHWLGVYELRRPAPQTIQPDGKPL